MYPRLVALLLTLAVAFVGGLFVVQNSSRTTQLSLDLGVAAWQLTDPVPVTYLIGSGLVAGLLVAGLPLLVSNWRKNKRIRRLEQQAAFEGGSTDWR